jgi:hypothetical protein
VADCPSAPVDRIATVDGHELRCSDVDRERVAEALRKAAADGRLTLSELEDRLEATFSARTYGDLQPITKDLPEGAYPIPGQQRSAWRADAVPRRDDRPATYSTPGPPAEQAERITAILSSQKRNAAWQAPGRIDATAVLGDVTLDFCEATVPQDEVVINVASVCGSVKLIVPQGVDVRTEDVNNMLGEVKHKVDGPAQHDGPVIRIRGFVLLGELSVRSPKVKRR